MKLFLLIIFFGLLPVTGEAASYKISDHYDGHRFFNPDGPGIKSFWSLLKWKMTGDTVAWPEKLPIKNFPYRPIGPSEKLSATFINHSTFLIELQDLHILTDPVYSERTSPFSFAGPMRVKEPGLPFDVLPVIDVVIISHNHYDHLDLKTLKRLDKKYHPLFVVPLGNAKLLRSVGIQNIKELDWWEEIKVKTVSITLTPARHWSARGLWDKNEALWGSFMIVNEKARIYFAGDTSYGPHFREIQIRYGSPDLALLPIGAYKPEWFMQDFHMNPSEAIQAHKDLGAYRSIGMHFGTFQLADEGIDEPMEDLVRAREQFQVEKEAFNTLLEGQAIFF